MPEQSIADAANVLLIAGGALVMVTTLLDSFRFREVARATEMSRMWSAMVAVMLLFLFGDALAFGLALFQRLNQLVSVSAIVFAAGALFVFLADRLTAGMTRSLHESQRVAAGSAELQTFVDTTSHDLKTPLVAIHGMAALLSEEHGKNLGVTGRRYLSRLMANASMMGDLISALVELARVGRGIQAEQRVSTVGMIHEI